MPKKTKTKIKRKKGNRLKIGLALSGGSALGIAHIGVIKAFEQNKIKVDCISGTSAGAVVAACFAFGVSLEQMIEISKKLSWLKISNFGYSTLGLNSNAPVGKIIKDYIGDKKIENAKIPLAIVATDIDTGKKVIFRKGSVAEAVMASACIPVFFTPVKIGKKRLVDGMLVENLPLSPLKEMGAELEVGVDLGAWMAHKKANNVLDVINNSYGIMVRQQSSLIKNGSEIIITPHLEKFTLFDFKNSEKLIRLGFNATLLAIPQIKLKSRRRKYDKLKNFFRKFFKSFSKKF
ncbi:MAG: patatin-like phospholipase family protein [Candidatus Moranbacteria bacterium]|nr:patatin-like phospholipase family protein [Candidatus Moranbacteria bacterium]